jgi:hypothetical protein
LLDGYQEGDAKHTEGAYWAATVAVTLAGYLLIEGNRPIAQA